MVSMFTVNLHLSSAGSVHLLFSRPDLLHCTLSGFLFCFFCWSSCTTWRYRFCSKAHGLQLLILPSTFVADSLLVLAFKAEIMHTMNRPEVYGTFQSNCTL